MIPGHLLSREPILGPGKWALFSITTPTVTISLFSLIALDPTRVLHFGACQKGQKIEYAEHLVPGTRCVLYNSADDGGCDEGDGNDESADDGGSDDCDDAGNVMHW